MLDIHETAKAIAAIWSETVGGFFNPRTKDRPMNILIIGHRGCGKTEIGKRLAEILNTTAHDSSWYMAERVIYPQLKDQYGYASAEECYADRDQHRQEWFELIEAYNDEPDRLTRAILSEGTIYVGMRSRMEFEGSKHHFDAIVWINASERVGEEPTTSMKLTQEDATHLLDNNGPLEDLPRQLTHLVLSLLDTHPMEKPPTLVFGMGATANPSDYILEQVIAGDEGQVSNQLGQLCGPGTDKPMSLLSVKKALDEASLEGAAKHWVEIKDAFQKVRGEICTCSWNPDSHADDCPVAILEKAIYP